MKKNYGVCVVAVLASSVALAIFGAGAAQASSPDERIVCTALPGQPWLGEAKIKAIFGMSDYIRVDFKVSRTHCYEFYAIRKNGDIVEAYYHPVTGEVIKRNVLLHATGEAAAASTANVAVNAASAASSMGAAVAVSPASAVSAPGQPASGY